MAASLVVLGVMRWVEHNPGVLSVADLPNVRRAERCGIRRGDLPVAIIAVHYVSTLVFG